MALPIHTPFAPMEALSVDEIPTGDQWQYEPKWDGFRCLAFRDGADVQLQSKAGQPLARYFPELVGAVSALPAKQFVLDGEIVIPTSDGGFSFDDLLQRIHPAASRIQRLSRETPALLIVFDLLVGPKGELLTVQTLRQRRPALEKFAAANFVKTDGAFRLSPVVDDAREAKKWLAKVGATLDGIIAKRTDVPYASGDRTGMQKIKNYRSADCVVGGFRYGAGKKTVGSLLLGLYDDDGLLHHVGFTSSIKTADKPAVTKMVEALRGGAGFTGRAPGGPSRWSTKEQTEWQPLEPSLVVEVSYDHFTGGRFRHGTKLLRWRPDKAPEQCRLDQVRQKSADLSALLRAA
jgi:ATP-dependent DNA ligase